MPENPIKVPNLDLDITGGKTVNLKNLKEKNIVIYFYPKDSTPGCTKEGQDFTTLYNKFKKSNTEVFGVSRDSLKSHENFKSKQKYSFDLISDSEEKLCKAFQVLKEKNLYGKKYIGIERSTFVIGTNGKVLKEWRNVKVDGHAKEVYEFIKTL